MAPQEFQSSRGWLQSSYSGEPFRGLRGGGGASTGPQEKGGPTGKRKGWRKGESKDEVVGPSISLGVKGRTPWGAA